MMIKCYGIVLGVFVLKHAYSDNIPNIHHNFVVHNCWQLDRCTDRGPKVCGFDEYEPYIAVFEDMCTFYKANCNQKGVFKVVEMEVCEMMQKHDKQHPNMTFEWVHIRNATIPSTTKSLLQRLNSTKSKRAKIVTRNLNTKLSQEIMVT